MTIGVSLTTAARSRYATVNTRCPPPIPMDPKSCDRSLRMMQYTYLPSSDVPLTDVPSDSGRIGAGTSSFLKAFEGTGTRKRCDRTDVPTPQYLPPQYPPLYSR